MKKWYKGNLHTHTTNSDGALSPEQVVLKYRDAGYDFLALTDHWVLSQNGYANGMTLLSGCEFDFGRNVRDGIYHVVALGFDSAPDITREDNVKSAIEKIHLAGGIADIAHPAWSLNTVEHLKNAADADFTEIYNSVSDLPRNCRPYSGDVIDKCAAQGLIFKLAGVDDTHWYSTDFARNFIYLAADECTPEAIKEAIKNGDFYASQGPRLSVFHADDRIIVDCPEEDEIEIATFFTDCVWDNERSVVGDCLTHIEHRLSGYESFIRVEVRDNHGNAAWSQIIPLR